MRNIIHLSALIKQLMLSHVTHIYSQTDVLTQDLKACHSSMVWLHHSLAGEQKNVSPLLDIWLMLLLPEVGSWFKQVLKGVGMLPIVCYITHSKSRGAALHPLNPPYLPHRCRNLGGGCPPGSYTMHPHPRPDIWAIFEIPKIFSSLDLCPLAKRK